MAEITKIEVLKIPEGKILMDAAPAGMEWKLVKKEKTDAEKLQEQLAVVEAELAQFSEPSKEELIEMGKSMHPYYDVLRRKEYIQGLINKV